MPGVIDRRPALLGGLTYSILTIPCRKFSLAAPPSAILAAVILAINIRVRRCSGPAMVLNRPSRYANCAAKFPLTRVLADTAISCTSFGSWSSILALVEPPTGAIMPELSFIQPPEGFAFKGLPLPLCIYHPCMATTIIIIIKIIATVAAMTVVGLSSFSHVDFSARVIMPITCANTVGYVTVLENNSADVVP